MLKTGLLIALLTLTLSPLAQAAERLELEGKNRIVNVYRAREIPEYLRSDRCTAYAYKQKFVNTVVDGRIQDGEVNAVGTFPSDMKILRRAGICLLILKQEGFLKNKKKPVTFYEIETFTGGRNEIRVGENHRPMDDDTYELESGLKFTVKDNVLVTNSP